MQKKIQGWPVQWGRLLKISVVYINLFFFLPTISFALDEQRILAIKTAYLFRFSLFVEWPEYKSETFTVCIADNERYTKSIQDTLENREREGKVIRVKNMIKEDDLSVCQLLYISNTTDEMKAFLIKTRGKPILTLGESSAFYHEQGMMYLYIVQNKIKFFINIDEINLSGLRVRAQLMALSEEPY